MAGWIDTKIFALLEGGLDGLSLRQRVLADNIANNDTPGFKRSDVDFQKVLQVALDNHQKRTQSGGGGPKELGSPFWDRFVIQDRSTSYRNDGNNVDIDLEMTRLAENTLHYNSLITMLTGHLNLYKQVIRD